MKTLTDYITEELTSSQTNNLPRLTELGDGEYEGLIWGHCFTYEGRRYYSELGTLSIAPVPALAYVEDGEVAVIKMPRNE